MTDQTDQPHLLTAEEKLKASFYQSTANICRSVADDNTIIGKFQINNDAIELISEAIFKKFEVYCEDLEAFAKHRKQSTINVEDVKLLARRNPRMKDHLIKFIAENQSSTNKKNSGTKKQKSKPSTSVSEETVPSISFPSDSAGKSSD